MKKTKAKILKECIEEITSLGAVKLEEPHRLYNYSIKTRVGDLYLKVEVSKQIVSLYGNFLYDYEAAKKELGHWKYNFHTMRENNDHQHGIYLHLTNVL